MTEREILQGALGRDDPAERAAYLGAACGGDEALRVRLEGVLRALRTAARIPASFAPDVTTFPDARGDPDHPADEADDRAASVAAGAAIGPYRLLRKLGEGGMGAVYMAEQEVPVRRRVALKLIKPGMDTDQVLARFEAERRALALMDHPNIARVLDAGTTDGGRPYFVMELVPGVPITRYCDERKLSTPERLALFVPVCRAIQHAHQKGIIHRDVKPSNVLVTPVDGKPVPKVIDFGVAKATDQRLTDRTLYTQLGAVIGTLEYMSPEQAEGPGLDVDTRSDVYSLGVVLYELLTGTTPLGRDRVRGTSYAEVVRRLREEDPPRPSTRLNAPADVAAARRAAPVRPGAVRGELDWIVMKALEKDRTRRYETAGGFARDVERYLAGDPVEACPPTAGYLARKFLTRYRAQAAAAAVAAAAVAVGVVGLIAGFLQARDSAEAARRSYAEAVLERERALRAGEVARESEARAGRAAREAQAVLDFFKDQVLTAARPEGQEGGLGKDVTVRTALDQAEPRIAGAFRGQPTAEASVRTVLGTTYWYLGEPELAARQHGRALELNRAALGDDDPATLGSQDDLAIAYQKAGRLDRAIPLLERTLAARAAALGPEHRDTLGSLNNLATAYQEAGQPARAIPLLERALAARARGNGLDESTELIVRNNLANALLDAGRIDRATPLLEQTSVALRTKFGPGHPNALMTQGTLAQVYESTGRRDRAVPLFEETLATQEAKLGADHPDTLRSRNNLATAYASAGRLDRAIPLFEQTLAAHRAKLGADHPSTLLAQNNLASAYQDAGRLAEALPLFEQTLAALRAKLGADHPSTLVVQANVANAYRLRGDPARAEPLLREAARRQKAALGAGHPAVANTLSTLGLVLMKLGRWGEAEAVLREGLAVRDAARPDDWVRFYSRSLLGECLLGRGGYAEAEPLLLSGYEGMKAREAAIRVPWRGRLADAAGRVARLYDATGRPAEAAAWRAKAGEESASAPAPAAPAPGPLPNSR